MAEKYGLSKAPAPTTIPDFHLNAAAISKVNPRFALSGTITQMIDFPTPQKTNPKGR